MSEINKTELIPRFDTKKSFYKKALIEYKGVNRICLYSYETLVSEIDKENNRAKVYDTYSNTTLRHIKEFLKQYGFKADSKKQIEEDFKPLLIELNESDFTKVNNDSFGNPRYSVHFTMLKPLGFNTENISKTYEFVLNLNKKLKLGGRKYHNKSYGGGLVFQSYNLKNTIRFLEEKLNAYYKEVA
jgi:hypothetical protein